MGPFESQVEQQYAERLQWTPWGRGRIQECLSEAVATRVPSKAIPTGRMRGSLKMSSSGWALLDVPNNFVRAIFDTLDEEGIELPISSEYGSKLNAHISVMSADEVEQAGGRANVAAHDGRTFRYQLGPMKVVSPEKSKDWKRVWYITVESPELEEFRKGFGLTPRPNNNHFDFHITVAVLPK